MPWGVPDRPLRFVSYNILHNQRGQDAVVAEINRLAPDFVLLQEIESRDVRVMAKALGMEEHHVRGAYHASVNLAGRSASWGNVILSKHPLSEARSIPNPGGGSFGVWAVSVVDGKRFYVACVHLSATWNANPTHIRESSNNRYKEITNLQRAWRDLGSPPIIIGGDFNQVAMGNNYYEMTRSWADALAALGKTDNTFKSGPLRTRIDYLLTSHHWAWQDGGVVHSDASDHRPIWLVTGAGPATQIGE